MQMIKPFLLYLPTKIGISKPGLKLLANKLEGN